MLSTDRNSCFVIQLDILALVIPSVEFMQAESERKDFKSAVNELTNELAELEHLNKPFVDSKAYVLYLFFSPLRCH